MKVNYARAAMFALGGVAMAFAASAGGQTVQPPAAAPQAQRTYTLTQAERAALTVAYQAAERRDWAAAQAALPAAVAAAQSADARYLVSNLQLQIAIQTQNPQLQSQAIDALIASGGAQPEEMSALLTNQAALALNAQEHDKADRALTRLAELNPGNPEIVARLAEFRHDRGHKEAAIALYTRAIQLYENAGRPAPEHWYQRALAIAFDGRTAQPSLALGQSLVQAYPTPRNWRDVLLIYRDVGQPDPAATLDLLRLMRASGALSGERDYLMYAEEAQRAEAPAEVKAVLDEGVSRGMLAERDSEVRQLTTAAQGRIASGRASLARLRGPAEAAADGSQALTAAHANLAYGEHAAAAELYRLALQKGGVDADLANLRLGIALALAGQRAEAEPAFRAVAGARQQLAAYWLVWLSRQTA